MFLSSSKVPVDANPLTNPQAIAFGFTPSCQILIPTPTDVTIVGIYLLSIKSNEHLIKCPMQKQIIKISGEMYSPLIRSLRFIVYLLSNLKGVGPIKKGVLLT